MPVSYKQLLCILDPYKWRTKRRPVIPVLPSSELWTPNLWPLVCSYFSPDGCQHPLCGYPEYKTHECTYMEFRKMVMKTLYVRQQERPGCIEQSFGLCGRGVRAGWYGRMALKHVNYHMWNQSPVQVCCMIQDAWGWCTGMTQRYGIGRVVVGGFRMGNTCTPIVDSSQCMAKPIQCCKVKLIN